MRNEACKILICCFTWLVWVDFGLGKGRYRLVFGIILILL